MALERGTRRCTSILVPCPRFASRGQSAIRRRFPDSAPTRMPRSRSGRSEPNPLLAVASDVAGSQRWKRRWHVDAKAHRGGADRAGIRPMASNPPPPLFQLGLLARQPPHGETSESQAWQERAWRFGARGSADTLDLLSRFKCAIWTSFPVDAAAAC